MRDLILQLSKSSIYSTKPRKGHSSAQYSGEIKGYDYDTYTFYAKKGQKVHVSISNEGADTYLFGPGIDDSVDLSRYSPELDSHGQYSLPASGKYELRVLQTRNDARKNKTKKYNVDIQIK
ncbi:PPC domain-containing protein [Escherichia coli]|uniref:PPC domain-containing protein n=1 Tax=Escherichia coli TaxID=562 RepID=UPI003CC90F4D